MAAATAVPSRCSHADGYTTACSRAAARSSEPMPEGYDETGSLVCRGGKFVDLPSQSAPDKTDRHAAGANRLKTSNDDVEEFSRYDSMKLFLHQTEFQKGVRSLRLHDVPHPLSALRAAGKLGIAY
ncbi:MAG: hypothetical protein ACLT75_09395 [Alistipes putredinis]